MSEGRLPSAFEHENPQAVRDLAEREGRPWASLSTTQLIGIIAYHGVDRVRTAAAADMQRRAMESHQRHEEAVRASTAAALEHAHRLEALATASGVQTDRVIDLTEQLRKLTVVITWLTAGAFLGCGLCGGTLMVRSRSHGCRRAYFYACSSFHHRGKTVCPNSLEMRLQDADEAVLTALEHELLDPAILEAAMARAAARVAAPLVDTEEARRHALETARTQTESALARLTEAVAAGGAIATLVQAIRDQARRHQTIRAELADLDRPRVAPLNVAQLKALLRTKAEEWQALLRKHAPIARQMVRKLVEGRIVFTPDRATRRYTFLATGTLANFFSGMVCPQAMASPKATDPFHRAGLSAWSVRSRPSRVASRFSHGAPRSSGLGRAVSLSPSCTATISCSQTGHF
jgi:hypothetical protein